MSLPNTEAIDNSYQHLSNEERKMISFEDVVLYCFYAGLCASGHRDQIRTWTK